MRDGVRRWSGWSWRPATRGGISTRSRGSTRSPRSAPPEGEHLLARVAELSARLVRCELKDAVAPETTPRCTSCGFQLGAASPQAELEDAMEGIRRALEIKLAALSHTMIARLIHNHDREHRLEGFLKITQAAQTDALVRVLDEKLARYLAQVLDENDSADGASFGCADFARDSAKERARGEKKRGAQT